MLTTGRVALSPVYECEIPVLHRWINDRDLVLSSAPFKAVSETSHKAWFDSIEKREDIALFGIRFVETGELIGTCQLCGIHPVHRSAELRIRIGDRDRQGQGYGKDAVRLLLRHGFSDLNLERIYLYVFATNQPAVRLYEHVGFVREGVLRRAAHIDGGCVDVVIMGILREEFAIAE